MFRYSILIASLILTACGSSGSGNPLDIPEIDGVEVLGVEVDSESDAVSVEIDTESEEDSVVVTGEVDADNGVVTTTEIEDAELNLAFVAGDGEIVTINSDLVTDLIVTGVNHTINIESNINMLTLGGNNTLLRFSDNVSVDVCVISGNDNTAEIGDNVNITCNIQGVGNVGFE